MSQKQAPSIQPFGNGRPFGLGFEIAGIQRTRRRRQRPVVYAHCQTCHSLSYVKEAKGLLPAQWDSLIASMEDYGLEVSDADKSKILAYLKTYLGPNPPPESQSQLSTTPADGSTIFQQTCSACHGPHGLGQPGYFPPLAGNADLTHDPVFPVLVVLKGISGTITVSGQAYNGSMPAFDHLSDAEVAAVVNFIRTAWRQEEQAPSLPPVTSELVAQQRQRDISPEQVRDYREQMLSE